MPGMDGTGPFGNGPGTGGGFGRCGYGRGSGRGRRNAAGYASAAFQSYRPSEGAHIDEPAAQEESAFSGRVLDELSEVKDRSAALEEKLAELTKAVQALARPASGNAGKTAKPH